jgi:hypothetical protein
VFVYTIGDVILAGFVVISLPVFAYIGFVLLRENRKAIKRPK